MDDLSLTARFVVNACCWKAGNATLTHYGLHKRHRVCLVQAASHVSVMPESCAVMQVLVLLRRAPFAVSCQPPPQALPYSAVIIARMVSRLPGTQKLAL
jgi:hypothetical protein